MVWELPRKSWTQAEPSLHHGLAKQGSCAPGHAQVSSCCRTLERWHVQATQHDMREPAAAVKILRLF